MLIPQINNNYKYNNSTKINNKREYKPWASIDEYQ